MDQLTTHSPPHIGPPLPLPIPVRVPVLLHLHAQQLLGSFLRHTMQLARQNHRLCHQSPLTRIHVIVYVAFSQHMRKWRQEGIGQPKLLQNLFPTTPTLDPTLFLQPQLWRSSLPYPVTSPHSPNSTATFSIPPAKPLQNLTHVF